jgi:hypothetical protein
MVANDPLTGLIIVLLLLAILLTDRHVLGIEHATSKHEKPHRGP